MSAKKESVADDIFIECPYCRVCSIKLSTEEYVRVKEGQCMIEVCQVCGKEVHIDNGKL